jgi:hypothetical protein
MTALRRLALRIASGTILLSPQGAKEWAQATSREIEFIESDWDALGWALDSLRILFRPSEARITALADVPQSASQFIREIRKRTIVGSAICVIETIWIGATVHTLLNPTQRLGCYLLIAAMLYLTVQLLARRGTLRSTRTSPANPSVYRFELERQREFHRGGWLWSRAIVMVPGFLLFCLGAAIAHPANSRRPAMTAVVFLVICVLAIPNNLRVARKYQRRIDELNAIESDEA